MQQHTPSITFYQELSMFHESIYFNFNLSEISLKCFTALALSDLRAVLRLNPAHAPAHKSRALLLEKAGDVTMAIHELTYAIKLRPDDVDGLLRRAQLYEQVSNPRWGGGMLTYCTLILIGFMFGFQVIMNSVSVNCNFPRAV